MTNDTTLVDLEAYRYFQRPFADASAKTDLNPSMTVVLLALDRELS